MIVINTYYKTLESKYSEKVLLFYLMERRTLNVSHCGLSSLHEHRNPHPQIRMKLSLVSSVIIYAGTALATGWSLSTSHNLNCTSQGEVLTFSSSVTPIPCTPIPATNDQTFIVNENAPNCMCT